jgi:hypothetical protein
MAPLLASASSLTRGYRRSRRATAMATDDWSHMAGTFNPDPQVTVAAFQAMMRGHGAGLCQSIRRYVGMPFSTLSRRRPQRVDRCAA